MHFSLFRWISASITRGGDFSLIRKHSVLGEAAGAGTPAVRHPNDEGVDAVTPLFFYFFFYRRVRLVRRYVDSLCSTGRGTRSGGSDSEAPPAQMNRQSKGVAHSHQYLNIHWQGDVIAALIPNQGFRGPTNEFPEPDNACLSGEGSNTCHLPFGASSAAASLSASANEI